MTQGAVETFQKLSIKIRNKYLDKNTIVKMVGIVPATASQDALYQLFLLLDRWLFVKKMSESSRKIYHSFSEVFFHRFKNLLI